MFTLLMRWSELFLWREDFGRDIIENRPLFYLKE